MVVLDMTMPQLDGEACLLALRELDPYAKIVITSGYSRAGRAGPLRRQRSGWFPAEALRRPTFSRQDTGHLAIARPETRVERHCAVAA